MVRLTTIDNPWNPFDDWDKWINYDLSLGYNCCAYLARIAKITDSMSDEEVEQETERAIDEILSYDFAGIYKKVSDKDSKTN